MISFEGQGRENEVRTLTVVLQIRDPVYPLNKMNCILCREEDGLLHEFQTLDADENVRKMATDLQETALLTRIEGGDLTALEAAYHLACLIGLRNRYCSFLRQRLSS